MPSWIETANITDNNSLIEIAKIAEQAERYDDMKDAINLLTKRDIIFGKDERNLFSVAWKNVVGCRRSSWRVTLSLEQRLDGPKKLILENFKAQIAKEMDEICTEVLKILDTVLIPKETTEEGIVFYKKMKGDYHRYLAEFKTDKERELSVKSSKEAYEEAMVFAKKNLTATNPIRLGLALNYSVFYFEIEGNCTEACTLAREAFDEAIAGLNDSNTDSYKDSTLVMQLLRDNLTLWNSENDSNQPTQ